MDKKKKLRELEENYDKLRTTKIVALIVSCLAITFMVNIPITWLKWLIIILSSSAAIAGQAYMSKNLKKKEEEIKQIKNQLLQETFNESMESTAQKEQSFAYKQSKSNTAINKKNEKNENNDLDLNL